MARGLVMRRGAWTLLALVACAAAGCAQVLDLDSYGPAGDGGVDATQGAEGGADRAVDQATADQTVDSPAQDAGLDSGSPGDSSSPGDTDSVGDGQGGPDAPSGDDAADSSSDFDSGCGPLAACAPPAPPGGWTGPLLLWEGTGTPPSCGGGGAPAFSGGANPPSTGAQCTCTCGPPSGNSCGPVVLTFIKRCGQGGNCGTVSLAPGSCTSLNAYDTACSQGGQGTMTPAASVAGSTGTGGGCTPDASTNVPMWSWGMNAVACAATGATGTACGTGGQGQCVPAPSPFEGRACVLKQGAATCPGAGYSVPLTYYASADDSRGCSACTCGSPTGVDCNTNAHVELWQTTGCDGGSTQALTPVPSGCVAPPAKMQGASFESTPTGGSCTPNGGQPTGTITPQTPTTICCTN